jgi:hypothetical protein
MNHNLNVGDYVKLSNTCNGVTYFQVYSLGNGLSNSEKFIFNVYDVGYNCTILENGGMGTFKRVIGEEVQGVSKYYVRKHKILTNFTDAVITKSGFEKNGLRVVKKFESKQLTPNLVSRVSVKEDSQSYNISFLNDIDIDCLFKIDNKIYFVETKMYKQKKRISARTLISLKFAYLFKIQIKRMESHAVGIESSILFCFLTEVPVSFSYRSLITCGRVKLTVATCELRGGEQLCLDRFNVSRTNKSIFCQSAFTLS